MGLDDFKQDANEESTESNKSEQNGFDNSPIEDIHDSFENKVSDRKYLKKGTSESLEHYKTKCAVALQLDRIGYKVDGEHAISVDGMDEKSIVDVYAELREGEDGLRVSTDGIDAIKNIVVEVGHYTARRANIGSSFADCIVWVPKGGQLSEAVIILNMNVNNEVTILSDIASRHNQNKYTEGDDDEVHLADKLNEQIEKHTFRDDNDKVFRPDVDQLYVHKYRLMSEHILYNYTNATNFDVNDILESINLENYTIDRSDVETVLNALGFLQ